MDVDEEGLKQTVQEVSSIIGAPNVLDTHIDVADLDEVIKFKEKVFEAWDEVRLHECRSWEPLCVDATVRP